MALTGRITEHFTWAEAVVTEHRGLAESNRLSLEANTTAQAAVRALCSTLLEPTRNHFRQPVFVHSLYRSPTLNTAIGGSSSSQHMRGEAADFHVAGVGLTE